MAITWRERQDETGTLAELRAAGVRVVPAELVAWEFAPEERIEAAGEVRCGCGGLVLSLPARGAVLVAGSRFEVGRVLFYKCTRCGAVECYGEGGAFGVNTVLALVTPAGVWCEVCGIRAARVQTSTSEHEGATVVERRCECFECRGIRERRLAQSLRKLDGRRPWWGVVVSGGAGEAVLPDGRRLWAYVARSADEWRAAFRRMDWRGAVVDRLDDPPAGVRSVRAKVAAPFVEVACGKCGEPLDEPESGSQLWQIEDLARADREAREFKCGACGAGNVIRLSRSVKLS